MFEETRHYAKLVGTWLGVRVINALAVSAAFFTDWLKEGSTASLAPLVAVPTGLAFATYVSTSQSDLRNRRMTNAYRHEIAALTGKPWREVDATDMERLANGNHEAHIPPVEVFDEQLERERSKRFLYMMGHVAAAVVAGVAIWAGFTHFTDTFLAIGEPIKTALVNHMPGSIAEWLGANMKPEVIPAMVSAGAITLTADTIFNVAGERMLGLTVPTVFEKVQDIKRDLRNGKNVTVEQVFDLVLDANPVFREGIETHYRLPFEKLPKAARADIISRFADTYPIRQMTADVNAGARSGNELAFFAYGQVSGVQPKVLEKEADGLKKSRAKALEPTRETSIMTSLGEMLHLHSGNPSKTVSGSQHQGFLAQHMGIERANKEGTLAHRFEQQAMNNPTPSKA